MTRVYRVVVVDDHEGELYLIQEAVHETRLPITLVTFRNSHDALVYLQTTTEPVDLVVVDLQMPVLPGPELVLTLREGTKTGSIPVVLTINLYADQLSPASVELLPAPLVPKQSSWQDYLRLVHEIHACLDMVGTERLTIGVAKALVARMEQALPQLGKQPDRKLVWKIFDFGRLYLGIATRGYYELVLGDRVRHVRMTDHGLGLTDLGPCTQGTLLQCMELCEQHQLKL